MSGEYCAHSPKKWTSANPLILLAWDAKNKPDVCLKPVCANLGIVCSIVVFLLNKLYYINNILLFWKKWAKGIIDLYERINILAQKGRKWQFDIDFCCTWIPSLAHIHPNSILLDLAKHGLTTDLQKIWISLKFGGCGSKTATAMSISILNFSRAWQSYFLSYTLEILITYRFFIDKKNDVLFIFLYLQHESWNLRKASFSSSK